MRFEFATAARILFGPGVVRKLGEACAAMRPEGRAFVVTGRSAHRAAPVLAQLAEHGISAAVFSVPSEPTFDMIRRGTAEARAAECGLVVAVGGGSVIDAGKVIAALLANGGDPLDYAEVIGGGRGFGGPPAPFVAVPTTAGAGAEVTRNGVIASPEHRVKVSLRSPLMLPRLAVVDPELTRSLPPDVTAATGIDALTQLIEPFVSRRANPLVDCLCREGMRRIARSIERACADGGDRSAREDMSLAALFGGLALANAGLGAVHGFAAPIGGMFQAPHGAVCAPLLPYVIAGNVRALRERDPGSAALQRYEEAARIVTGRGDAGADDAASWAEHLCKALKVKPLSACGLSGSDVPLVVEKAAVASSMQGNPIRLTGEEMAEILGRAIRGDRP